MRARVHQNGGFVSVLKRVCKIKTTNAEVDHPHLSRQMALRQTPSYFHAKAVVTKKDIANPGNQDLRLLLRDLGLTSIFCNGFNFFRTEEETMARLAQQPQVATGIKVQYNAYMLVAFIILLKRFHGGCLSGQRDIEHIAALARAQPYTITGSHFSSRDD